MEEIFNNLIEIETAADRIQADAEQKRLRLSVDAEQQMSEYDRKLAEKTDERINEIRSGLQEEKEERVRTLREESEKSLHALETYYEANHKRLADVLFKKIIN